MRCSRGGTQRARSANASKARRRLEWLGDVIDEEGDIFGDGVNVAARLEALADPGGICVSRTVRNHVRDKLPYAFEDMGEQVVKNIARYLGEVKSAIEISGLVGTHPAADAS